MIYCKSYCKRYGNFASKICPKLHSDDFDELVDYCESCASCEKVEIKSEGFDATCLHEYCGILPGQVVKVYSKECYLVVGGYMTTVDEYRQNFKENK